MNGFSGEGVRRGRRGWDSVFGEISGGSTSTLAMMEKETFEPLNEEHQDVWIPAHRDFLVWSAHFQNYVLTDIKFVIMHFMYHKKVQHYQACASE